MLIIFFGFFLLMVFDGLQLGCISQYCLLVAAIISVTDHSRQVLGWKKFSLPARHPWNTISTKCALAQHGRISSKLSQQHEKYSVDGGWHGLELFTRQSCFSAVYREHGRK